MAAFCVFGAGRRSDNDIGFAFRREAVKNPSSEHNCDCASTMGWFLVTIGLPILAPVAGLLVFRLLPLPAAATDGIRLVVPMKDGQLCWAAMGFCAAGLYELFEPARNAHILEHSLAGWASAWFETLLTLSALVAAGGAVFPTAFPRPANAARHHHYSTMLASLVLTSLSAGGYAVLHSFSAA